MEPRSKQVNEVRCDLSYKSWFDAVEIRGKNLPSEKLGANGKGLFDNLRGCGAVTSCKVETTPNDVKFQWYAYAQLPIGNKPCVGRAIQNAGGSSNGGCGGARRRSPDASGIDDWPGYGDESKHVFGASKRDDIDSWPGYGDESKHVFGNAKRDGVDSWPGYGDNSKHVFGQAAQ